LGNATDMVCERCDHEVEADRGIWYFTSVLILIKSLSPHFSLSLARALSRALALSHSRALAVALARALSLFLSLSLSVKADRGIVRHDAKVALKGSYALTGREECHTVPCAPREIFMLGERSGLKRGRRGKR